MSRRSLLGRSLRRRLALAACAVVAAVGVVPAVVTAADVSRGAIYAVTGGTLTRFRWDWEQRGSQSPCDDWGRSRGFVRARLTQRGGFNIFNLPGSGLTGGIESLAGGTLRIERDLDYRIHKAARTRACTPCGVSS